MTDTRQQILLTVPRDLVVESPGVTMDIGSSLVKIVYRTEEDYQEALGKTGESATGQLRLTCYSRSDRQAAYQFIKDNAYIKHEESEPTSVYTCGVGCSEYAAEILEALNIKVNNVDEMGCHVHAFQYLAKRMPRSVLLHPLHYDSYLSAVQENEGNAPAYKQALEDGQLSFVQMDNDGILQMEGMLEDMKKQNERDAERRLSTEPLATAEGIFPCLYAICGSGIGILKVNEDGTSDFLDIDNAGGRTLHGLANVLVGTQDYRDFLAMAEKGDEKSIHTYMSDFYGDQPQTEANEGGADQSDLYQDMFAQVECDPMTFYFGKGFSKAKDEFKKEDLARALLTMYISDLGRKLHMMARLAKVKHVFLGGTLPSETLIQQIMTREFARLNGSIPLVKLENRDQIQIEFLIPGSQLGALGALINSVQKFL